MAVEPQARGALLVLPFLGHRQGQVAAPPEFSFALASQGRRGQ